MKWGVGGQESEKSHIIYTLTKNKLLAQRDLQAFNGL